MKFISRRNLECRECGETLDILRVDEENFEFRHLTNRRCQWSNMTFIANIKVLEVDLPVIVVESRP